MVTASRASWPRRYRIALVLLLLICSFIFFYILFFFYSRFLLQLLVSPQLKEQALLPARGRRGLSCPGAHHRGSGLCSDAAHDVAAPKWCSRVWESTAGLM